MQAYKNLVSHVLNTGTLYDTPKGKCHGVIGAQVTYDIEGKLPVVTGKKTNILWAIAEYTMFLKGITHVDFLRDYGAEKIWESQSLSQDITSTQARSPVTLIEELAEKTGKSLDEVNAFFRKQTEIYTEKRGELDRQVPLKPNPEPKIEANTEDYQDMVIDREAYQVQLDVLEAELTKPFTDLGIELTEEVIIKHKGDLGPIYGQQWRAWPALDPRGQRVHLDQLRDVVKRLQDSPDSRQIVLTSWNPINIVPEKYSYDQKIANGFMGQPPCHVNYHFLTRVSEAGERELHLTVWFRSNDLMLGHPFNAIGSALIAHGVAKAAGLKAKSITMQISDAHLYENHLDHVQQYLDSEIFESPSFNLPEDFDIFNFEVEQVMESIGEYQHGPYIPFTLNTTDTVETN